MVPSELSGRLVRWMAEVKVANDLWDRSKAGIWSAIQVPSVRRGVGFPQWYVHESLGTKCAHTP